MDNWDDIDEFSTGTTTPARPHNGENAETNASGGWHWLMTVVCFITVTILSFLVAWLTKDTINRPFWMIGAIFTVPTLGMFFAAMMVEQKTSAMTPSSSRSKQYLVAAIAAVLTFAVGCVCDLIYQHGTMDTVIRNWAQTHPPEKTYADIVLMVDKSSSLEANGMDSANRTAIQKWLKNMDDKARVGIVVFSNSVIREVPIDILAKNRPLIENAVEVPTGGATDFDTSLYHAFYLIDQAENERKTDLPTQIIAITDAEAVLPQKVMEEYSKLAKNRNIVFSIVHLGQDVPTTNPLVKLAVSTGGEGTSLGVSELSKYFEGVKNVEEPDWNAYYKELRNSGKVDFDLIRVSDPEANLLTGIMLGLEGLSIGLCLMLMLSVVGQKRIQPLISTVMAAATFVLLKIVGPGIGPVKGVSKIMMPQWILEGIAFSFLGIVFMLRNNRKNSAGGGRRMNVPAPDNQFDQFGDDSTSFSGGNENDSF